MACKFLRYIVEETLAGRAGELKEHVLGREACGRGDDFDPRLDPVVRVQAGKLRARLAAYYQGEGSEEPLRIHLPKGSYVPEFHVFGGPATEEQPRLDETRTTTQSKVVRALAFVAVIVLAISVFLLTNRTSSAPKQAQGLQIRIPISLPPPLELSELATPTLS